VHRHTTPLPLSTHRGHEFISLSAPGRHLPYTFLFCSAKRASVTSLVLVLDLQISCCRSTPFLSFGQAAICWARATQPRKSVLAKHHEGVRCEIRHKSQTTRTPYKPPSPSIYGEPVVVHSNICEKVRLLVAADHGQPQLKGPKSSILISTLKCLALGRSVEGCSSCENNVRCEWCGVCKITNPTILFEGLDTSLRLVGLSVLLVG
jgi:hypothetical protein